MSLFVLLCSLEILLRPRPYNCLGIIIIYCRGSARQRGTGCEDRCGQELRRAGHQVREGTASLFLRICCCCFRLVDSTALSKCPFWLLLLSSLCTFKIPFDTNQISISVYQGVVFAFLSKLCIILFDFNCWSVSLN